MELHQLGIGDVNWMQHAIAASDVVWRRGFLTKGGGLCHGSSGNALSLLEVYRLGDRSEFLQRASAFFMWMREHDELMWKGENATAVPNGLFMGRGGAALLALNLLLHHAGREAMFGMPCWSL